MSYLTYLVAVIVHMCLEISCMPPDGINDELEKREVTYPKFVQTELLAHLQKYRPEKNGSYRRPFFEPKQSVSGSMDSSAYAKATCTTYPGRVVCQLGRYTFVINNGNHRMDPEIIERFAAMVYHRSQEGDASFDVSVDVPIKISEDYFMSPRKETIEATTRTAESLNTPVFVECTPIPDDRKMCNPPYSPTEVIYSCKRRELGGIEKRMIVSVDSKGSVSAGDLVLPYSALLERRFKRQKDNNQKAEIGGLNSHWTKQTVDNKIFSDICSIQHNNWCPNSSWTNCPDTCVTAPMKDLVYIANNNTQVIASSEVKQIFPMKSNQLPSVMGSQANMDKPLAPIENNDPIAAENYVTQQAAQGVIVAAKLFQNSNDKILDTDNKAELYAVSRLPPPMVRVYSDTCGKQTILPWCPANPRPTECTISGCVTLPECGPNNRTNKGNRRKRQDQQKLKKPFCPLARHRLNRMRTYRRLGQKRVYIRKRKRHVSSMCTTCAPLQTSCSIPCKMETTPMCTLEAQSVTEFTTSSISCLRKREVMRKRKRINHLLWPKTSRERYILE